MPGDFDSRYDTAAGTPQDIVVGTGPLAAPLGAVHAQVTALQAENVQIAGSVVPAPTGTDDTTNIQTAISAGAGKIVTFPKGNQTYIVSASLTIPSNTIVDLGGNTIQQKAGSNTQNGLFYVASGTTKVTLKNGTIDVNVANQSYTGANTDVGRGVFAYSADHLVFDNLKIINPYGSHILLAACNYAMISNCDIHDENGTGTSAISLNGCTYVKVNQNVLTGKVAVSGFGIYAYGTCTNIKIYKNSLHYYQIACIGNNYIWGGQGTGSSMAYVSVEDNEIIEPSADSSIHFGIHSTFCNNIIFNSHDVGISIDYSIHTVVNDNVIRTTNASGIAAPGCCYCTFIGNMISNPASQWIRVVSNNALNGIWLPINNGATGLPAQANVSPVGNTVIGNTISDELGTHSMYTGISIDNSNNNINVVEGNFITGYVNAAYNVPSQTVTDFVNPWQNPTLANSWVNNGGATANAQYAKDLNGIVRLRGMVKGGAVGSIMFNLPAGYRPAYQLNFPLITYASGGSQSIGQLQIDTAGNVYFMYGSNGWVSLDGITFRLD